MAPAPSHPVQERILNKGFLAQRVRASCLAGGLVSALLVKTKVSFSEDFSQLESVGVSNNCVFNSITEFVYLLFTFQKSLVNIRLYKCVQFSDTRL